METDHYSQQQPYAAGDKTCTTPNKYASGSGLQDDQSLSEPVSPILQKEPFPSAQDNHNIPGQIHNTTDVNDKEAPPYPSASASHEIETGYPDELQENKTTFVKRAGRLDFVCGCILGLLIGPFSLLFVLCWRSMAIDDTRRTRFLMGCAVGIITQIFGFAIAYSVYKLKSRRVL